MICEKERLSIRIIENIIWRQGGNGFDGHPNYSNKECGERGSDATLWCGKQKIELNHKMLWFLWWIE